MGTVALPLRPLLRMIVVVGTLVGLLAGVAACGAVGDLGGGYTGGEDVAGDEGGGGGFAEPREGDDARDDDQDRHVITTAMLTVVVDDALEAADDAARIAEAAGGRVDERTEQPGLEEGTATAYLTLRVPADRVARVLEDLQELGDPRNLAVSREDVTLTVTDLDARIRALEVSIARLEELMGNATSTADLLEAERALTERQSDLDSLRARRTHLGEQVALATISVELFSRASAPAPSPGGFWGGVVQGWTALVTTLNRAVVALGAVVPWALFAGLVTAVVLLARRLRRRRGTARGPQEGAPPPQAE